MLHNQSVEEIFQRIRNRRGEKKLFLKRTNTLKWENLLELSCFKYNHFCIYFREEKLFFQITNTWESSMKSTSRKVFFIVGEIIGKCTTSHIIKWKCSNFFFIPSFFRNSYWRLYVKEKSKIENTAKKTPMGKEWRQTASLQRKSYSVVKNFWKVNFFFCFVWEFSVILSLALSAELFSQFRLGKWFFEMNFHVLYTHGLKYETNFEVFSKCSMKFLDS